jgi:protein SMG7
LRLLPAAGGNSYNQLAVLSSYEGDDLAAAFFYIRALAAAAPFAVARENLVTHFEQNRVAAERLAAAAAAGGPAGSTAAPPPQQQRGMRSAGQALKELRIRWWVCGQACEHAGGLHGASDSLAG